MLRTQHGPILPLMCRENNIHFLKRCEQLLSLVCKSGWSFQTAADLPILCSPHMTPTRWASMQRRRQLFAISEILESMRVFLVCFNDSKHVHFLIIDRALHVWRTMFAVLDDTIIESPFVLDCEMVYNTDSKSWMLIVLDCLVQRNQSTSHESLTQRMQFVVQLCTSLSSCVDLSPDLVAKHYYLMNSKRNIHQMILLTTMPGFSTTGFVCKQITKLTAGSRGNDSSASVVDNDVKFRSSSLVTVDLMLDLPTNKLFARENDTSLKLVMVGFCADTQLQDIGLPNLFQHFPRDSVPALPHVSMNDCNSMPPYTRVVVECQRAGPPPGHWKPIFFRFDKRWPNTKADVTRTWQWLDHPMTEQDFK